MVTTADDDVEVESVGAIAAFGGKVQAVVSETSHRISYGETRLLTPMGLIVLTYIPVLAAPEWWQRGLGVITLIALTVWCCVQVLRKGAKP